MNFENKYKDYYKGYDSNTFFAIDDLQKRIPKVLANIALLNAAIFWYTNLERLKHGLKPFLFHEKLMQMATLHSEQMRNHKFFDHENKFDVRFKTLRDRLEYVKDDGFSGFMCFAENIADCPVIKANESFTYSIKDGVVHFYTMAGKEFFPYTYSEMAKSVVDAWMNSPGHRANILNPDYIYLGCGCAPYEEKEDSYSVTYFKLTQNFGGELVPPSIIKMVKQTIRTVLNPHGMDKSNKTKSNASFGGWRQNKKEKTMVTNQGLSCNVDLVFCIEITKKMFCMLSIIKEEVRRIYSLYVDSFRERGKAIGKFRIKIITFGSQMSKKIDTFDFVEIPNNEKKLDTILGSIRANAEVGEYCSGIEALSKAINSDWNREGERRNHVIIVYSSSSTLPVISRDCNIEDKYTIEWERIMEDSAKRLILFTPDAESWTDIANYWEKVIHIPSQAGFGLSLEEYDLLLLPVIYDD